MKHGSTVIKITNVHKSFGKTKALDDIDLEVQSGRIVGLLGANGSGKSTLIRHFIGLYLPDDGECLTFDTPSKSLGPKELAHIGYVHQVKSDLSANHGPDPARYSEWATGA